MKKIFVFILLVSCNLAYAQFGGLANKLKQKAKEAVERQTDKTMDKIVGKGENKVDEKVDETLEGGKKKSKTKTELESGNDGAKESAKLPKAIFSVSSTFDFIPGEKIVATEDFAQDAKGDFPAKWNTNASGEVVTLGPTGSQKWLKLEKTGIHYPEFVGDLPENFTLEFDMYSNELSEMKSGLKVVFPISTGRNLKYDQHFSSEVQVGTDIHPINEQGTSWIGVIDQSGEQILSNELAINWKENAVNRISIWRQKSRFRMYINEVKVWDIPRAFVPNVKYSLLFATNLWSGNVYLSDLKLAYGLPDTRSKLITEGKFSTNGILFDVNADEIKASSAGILKEIATVLNENPTVKVKIIGHTDTDGAAEANLQLSKRRAAAVAALLSKNYGVAADRMQTDGKGASQPVDNNQTAQGKANNRRVEFVKL